MPPLATIEGGSRWAEKGLGKLPRPGGGALLNMRPTLGTPLTNTVAIKQPKGTAG
jgi:hypothetical protein